MNINQASVVGYPSIPTDNRKPFFSRFGWNQEIIFVGNDAPNTYNSLQTKVDKRFSNGVQFIAHYTWSKSLDMIGSTSRLILRWVTDLMMPTASTSFPSARSTTFPLVRANVSLAMPVGR